MFPELGHWLSTLDGDPQARAIFDRHEASKEFNRRISAVYMRVYNSYEDVPQEIELGR